MEKKSKFLYFIFLLIIISPFVYADIPGTNHTCGTQNSQTIEVQFTIPGNKGIYRVLVDFRFFNLETSIDLASSDSDIKIDPHDETGQPGGYYTEFGVENFYSPWEKIVNEEEGDYGYKVRLHNKGTHHYQLEVIKKHSSDPEFTEDETWKITISIDSGGTDEYEFSLRCIKGDNDDVNGNGFISPHNPTGLEFSSLNPSCINRSVDSIYIQYSDTSDVSHSTHTVGDFNIPETDSITLYAIAYDSNNDYIGAVEADWSIASPFDLATDINGGAAAAVSEKSIQFSPDNFGSTNITASYPASCNIINEYSTGTITVAGPLSKIVITNTKDNPHHIDDAFNTTTMTASQKFTLYAAGYDSSNRYRKPETVEWGLDSPGTPPDFTEENLTTETGPPRVIFDPNCAVGIVSKITAAHTTVQDKETGQIIVNPNATIDDIAIRNSNESSLDTNRPLDETSVELHAFSLDSCENVIGPVLVSWSIVSQSFTDGAEGSLTEESGKSTIFEFPETNLAGNVVIKADYNSGTEETEITLKKNAGPAAPSGLRISTANDGTGFIVQNHIMETADLPLNLYAVAYDADGNFAGTVPATWAWEISDDSFHTVNASSTPVIFNHNGGTGITHISVASTGMDDYAGTITVIPDQTAIDFDVVHVLDRSGSMGKEAYDETGSPTKMEVVKDSASYFVDLMREDRGNRYGLVIFDNIVSTLVNINPLSSTSLTFDTKDVILSTRIPSIFHRNTTSIGGGLIRGLNQLELNSGHDESILLLTDGKHNTYPSIQQFITQYQALSDSNLFPIHIIAIGYDAGVDEERLLELISEVDDIRNINPETDPVSTYRRLETGSDLPLKTFKVFNDILLLNNGESLIADPVTVMRKGDPPFEIPVHITADMTTTAFSVFWEGGENALNIKLQAPNGTIIEEHTQNNRIRFGGHPNYKFFDLRFPLSGELNSAKAGQWKLLISVANHVTESSSIKMISTISAKGETELEAGFDKRTNLTGEPVAVTAKVTRDGRPVPGIEIQAEVSVPITSVANLLHKTDINLDQLRKEAGKLKLDGTWLGEKITLMEKTNPGSSLVKRKTETITLYDDGKHNDGMANDGIYGTLFTNTTVPGSYNFRFIAGKIPIEGGKTTTREWNTSFVNKVNVANENSLSNITLIDKTDNGYIYEVEYAPRDNFNNFLGPGFTHSMVALYNDLGITPIGELKDNLDGTYTGRFVLNHNQVASDPTLRVIREGRYRYSDSMTSDFEDRVFEKKIPTHYDGVLSLHTTMPISFAPLASQNDFGFGGTIDFGYRFTPFFAAIGLVDILAFRPAPSSSVSLFIFAFNLDAKFTLGIVDNTLSVYLYGGGSIFFPNFSQFDLGLNGGVGFFYEINSNFLLDINWRANWMALSRQSYQQISLGIVWQFQVMH